MIVFHGSNRIIERPIYGYGKTYNDYGLGFYCTENLDLAKEWAVDLDCDGYANKYSLDLTGMSVLDLSNEIYGTINWLAILLDNRDFDINTKIAAEAKKYILDRFLPDYECVDIIRGYRADDSYFSFARAFLNNTISLEQLGKAMKYGDLGEQIVLKSKKAFESISFEEAFGVEFNVWYPLKEKRDSDARNNYRKLDSRGFQKGEIYVLKIVEEELGIDDLRLR